MLRWSDAGASRFESVWRWLSDLLAFPIVFSPLTDWSWLALDSGTALAATFGFLTLTAVWTFMLSAPLIFVGGWWVVITQRLAGSSSASSGFTDFDGPISAPYSSSPSSLQSPSRALYLITLPLALAWAGIQKLVSPISAVRAGPISGALCVFLVTFAIVAGFMAAMFGFSNYWERDAVLERVANTMWYGYLDTLYVPRIFEGRRLKAMTTIYAVSAQTDFHAWPAYMGAWYDHAEFRTVVWVTAARHGLVTAIVFLIWRLLRRKH